MMIFSLANDFFRHKPDAVHSALTVRDILKSKQTDNVRGRTVNQRD